MTFRKHISILSLLFVVCFAGLPGRSAHADDSVAYVIASWLGDPARSVNMCLGCEQIAINEEIMDFYRQRNFEPVWVNAYGLTRLGSKFVEQIKNAEDHGLQPSDYHYECITAWLDFYIESSFKGKELKPADMAGLDLLLSDAFIIFGDHLANGKVGPRRAYSLTSGSKNSLDMFSVLTELDRTRNLDDALKMLAPPHTEYWRLVEAGKSMKKIVESGGWPKLPKGGDLEKGDISPDIAILRERLFRSGDLKGEYGDNPQLFDDNLEIAVKIFQKRHGISSTGLVSRLTRAALNVSAESRWKQIAVNLDRRRRYPRFWGQKYIMVNTASFILEAYDNGQRALKMRVVVGKRTWKTPEFSAVVKYMEVNPYWYVPRSIMGEIKSKKGYEDYGESGLRQPPGPRNALGRLKIVFPNRHNVYLHDTPSKYLFARNYRAYSHGCIRLAEPVNLGLFLFRDDPEWTLEHLQKVIRRGVTKRIQVEEPIHVHILYLTAWVGDEGEIQFRNDIYNRDIAFKTALLQPSARGKRAPLPMEYDTRPGSCSRIVASPAVKIPHTSSE